MNTTTHLPSSRWSNYREDVVTSLVGWIPAGLGRLLRRLLYHTIVARMGASVQIQHGVEFINAYCLEIGNRVWINRHVQIKNIGQNRIRLGDRVLLNQGVSIEMHSGDGGCIEIGDRTSIGIYSCLSGRHIYIGKDCLIAPQVGIFAHSYVFADPTRKIREQGLIYKGIVIQDDCWLGYGAKVLDGVTIGQGSVIGAGAVVTEDIPPYSVAIGIPAKVVAKREQLGDSTELDFVLVNN